ncbi:MAG: aminoacyl-tRNA hydrolase [Nanoarchaeota archaeon]|nr:aminoacyl-tRNA hydrolase [Nanoarchaeota archaeon]
MKTLIVGLGNPGKKYEKTRHNVGFRIIDELEKQIFDVDIILLKPDNFMNNSGRAVKKIIRNSKFEIQNLIIVHDDIDLPFGTIRTSKNSSSAGHKGVQSIIDTLGTKNFTRIRIGIKPSHEIDTTKFVLKNFSKDEEEKLPEIIKKAVGLIPIPPS